MLNVPTLPLQCTLEAVMLRWVHSVKRMSLSPFEMQWYTWTHNTHCGIEISFQLTSIQLSLFTLGILWSEMILMLHFDGLLWVSKLLSVYMRYKMEIYLLKIYLMKKVGDLGFDLGAWRLNVGFCGCNASMCSSSFISDCSSKTVNTLEISSYS